MHINLSRLFPNFRQGTGFLSKLDTPSGKSCDEIYGVVTNNHVLRSETDAKNALVTFEGTGKGKEVKLQPEIKFRTEMVSAVCVCDPMQSAFEGFQNFVGLEGIFQHATS